MVPVHQISSPQVVVAIVETVVVEEVDMVPAVINKDNSSRRNHRTPCSIKTRCKPQFVKSVGRLATLQISVGADLHKLVVIHLGVVSPSPEVEIEVHMGQAVVQKDVKEEGSLQWLMTSHME